MSEQTQRPQLKFETNVPIQVAFPFGDFRRIDGQYGAFWRYNVDVNTQPHQILATEKLHRILQFCKVARGTTLTICKLELENNARGWGVKDAQGNILYNDKDPSMAKQLPPMEKPPQQSAGTPPSSTYVLDDLSTLMEWCVGESVGIWERANKTSGVKADVENIRTTSDTLFIAATRNNLKVHPTATAQKQTQSESQDTGFDVPNPNEPPPEPLPEDTAKSEEDDLPF